MRKELFDQLVAGIKEMKAVERDGTKPARVTRSEDLLATDVRTLRSHFGLSQAKFAALLGISVDTLQNWEQGRRKPDGPAKVLLRVAAKHPEALLSVGAPPPRARKSRDRALA